MVDEEDDPEAIEKHSVRRRHHHRHAEAQVPQPIHTHSRVGAGTVDGNGHDKAGGRRGGALRAVKAQISVNNGRRFRAKKQWKHVVVTPTPKGDDILARETRLKLIWLQLDDCRKVTAQKRRSHHQRVTQHREHPPQDQEHHVAEEPPVVARPHAVADERTVVVESPHAATAGSAVPRPQRPLDGARVARRAGHGARAALQPHQGGHRVLHVFQVVVVVAVLVWVSARAPRDSLALFAGENAYSAVETRGHRGVRRVNEPVTKRKEKRLGVGRGCRCVVGAWLARPRTC